jgi:superfamily II DNA/RNA helicase
MFPFCTALGLKHLSIYGGVPKQQQLKAMKAGLHVLVATPGRLLDFLQSGGIKLQDCSFVVLDEADKMLSMGFEAQIKAVIAQV